MSDCLLCRRPLRCEILDLGVQPPANAYRAPADLNLMEPHYPLKLMLCPACGLAQLSALVDPGTIFREYDYFSSYSSSWLRHAEAYVERRLAERPLGRDALVVEVASNDGYLLQYFVRRGVEVLGVEPAENVAEAARARGVPTESFFWGRASAGELRRRRGPADLLVANNVLAHVPDLNDFVAGFAAMLKPGGLATFEFPHLERLLAETQFDTIYHEHYSYLTLTVARRLFRDHGLTVFEVEELPTHGGSLRLYAALADGAPPVSARVAALLAREEAAGLGRPESYAAFSQAVARLKLELLDFLLTAKKGGRLVLGYGAAAKGNTLLNYAGLKPDLLPAVADLNPAKQGKFLPGSLIPVVSPGELAAARPDYVLILPWNLAAEITAQLAMVKAGGGRFVTAVPGLKIWP
ncbi:MAG: class I SAM-dependent methyltransferase [Candidatus Adiutrix sp.]|jgi:SAM-dependent methyltransferase|nr:class I SAM-dependent methyltransferase [Candidatus Adiutrix sp.]